jgi:hypothetical protein
MEKWLHMAPASCGEGNGSRAGESAGEPGENGQAGVKQDPARSAPCGMPSP